VTEAEFRALKPGDVIATQVVYVDDEGDASIDSGDFVLLQDCAKWERVVAHDPVTGRLAPVAGYDSLASVLDEALAQAQAGKGKERHANGEPYDAQKIVTLNLQIGSEHGAIFQGCKKAQESARLEAERGDAELLGAINYLAAAVIIRRKLRAKAGGK
jgi:hypothetical protein